MASPRGPWTRRCAGAGAGPARLGPDPALPLAAARAGDPGGANGHSRVLVAELNDGQMRREIERLACSIPGLEVAGVHRLDGELITPEQIRQQGGLL